MYLKISLLSFYFSGVLEEAEFYNITELINLVKERILQRDKKLCSEQVKKHTYRVLQCHEDELTWMISTMSDEWKFEQVMCFYNFFFKFPVLCLNLLILVG